MSRTVHDRVACDVDVDVAIVGAGATGLFLACRLLLGGATVALLERRAEPTRHARAIGIHPPGLAALQRLGVAEELIALGVPIRAGHASTGDVRSGVRSLGTLDFTSTLPDPWRFVLSVPQYATERVLEDRLRRLAPDALKRNTDVLDWSADDRAVTVRLRSVAGRPDDLRCALLVACDGSRGGAAARLAIRARGGWYPDTYLMADLPDRATGPLGVPLGDDAAIHLAPGGVVEAFPLPHGRRRWVVRTDRRVDPPDPLSLARLVHERTGVRLEPDDAIAPTSFGVQRWLLDRLGTGRCWLCGDAAHVVAPLGGQGMTLAWLGAEALAGLWEEHLAGRMSLERAAAHYQTVQGGRARRAAARAAWNLRMGRPTRLAPGRAWLVRALLTPPLDRRMARMFTMHGR